MSGSYIEGMSSSIMNYQHLMIRHAF